MKTWREEDGLRSEIINFLDSNRHISKLNFRLKHHRISPSAYKRDVLNAIKNDDIEVEISSDLSKASAAAYQSGLFMWWDDRLKFPPEFSLQFVQNQGIVIHECTHAFFDFRNIGEHSLYANEATAYIAQYLFLQASGHLTAARRKRLIGFRRNAAQIASGILSGHSRVPDRAADNLIRLIASHPNYARQKKTRISDGV